MVMAIVVVIVVTIVYQNASAHKKSGGNGNDSGFVEVLHIESPVCKAQRCLNLNCLFVFFLHLIAKSPLKYVRRLQMKKKLVTRPANA
ncbi:hypothetical protein [Succinimonas sp.]|uniref:hypothetical protein n=1 Tax=Succinimonas sp. TaxID=1936151 RepID=UPI0038689410